MLKWWIALVKRKDPQGWRKKLFRNVLADATVEGSGGLGANALGSISDLSPNFSTWPTHA